MERNKIVIEDLKGAIITNVSFDLKSILVRCKNGKIYSINTNYDDIEDISRD